MDFPRAISPLYRWPPIFDARAVLNDADRMRRDVAAGTQRPAAGRELAAGPSGRIFGRVSFAGCKARPPGLN